MARRNTSCSTAEPVTNAAVNPSPVCTGTIIRYEAPFAVPVTINKVTYTSYEQCQKCGKVYPG